MASVRGGTQKALSSTSRCAYQVFLSFRGDDTRKNFTDHLYTALVNAGFHTFRDDDELNRGENIESELAKAIRQSEISVIIFSKDYASSRWCLDELANILERRRSVGHMVLPVFYHIDPSDVRKQTGTFAEAFVRHEKRFKEEMDRVEGWRVALRQAADLAGMALQNQANGHEGQFIQNIIKEIARKLNRTMLNVALHPTGTDSRMKDIQLWLEDGSSDIGIGVICGMGGIGKTTMAKIAYNLSFNNFEGSSFLANIREASRRPNGLVRLQRQLVSDILRGKKIKINNVDEGVIKIKDGVCCKRVLLVLDDIDKLDQLNTILGMRNWFYPGSKIIITSRHERLLKAHEPCEVFKVEKLNNDESLQLFSWHAFGQSHPLEGYMEHSRSIVQHCGGLPLALQVLGSSLSGRSVDVWQSASQKLGSIPDSQILKILKISYDSLRDDHDKNLFLDLTCFFVGKNKDYTITILDGCDFYTTVGIQNLIDRCLIEIDEDNKLQMHQLLQDMGKEIVRQESPKYPGKQSRLWDHKDAFSVLRKKTGTEAIEGLILDFPMVTEDMHDKEISYDTNAKRRPYQDILDKWTLISDKGSSAKRRRLGFFYWHPGNTSSQKSSSMPKMGDLSTEAFAMMHRLRLLSLNYVELAGGFEDFPKEIRWMSWHGFPLEFIPSNLCLQNLVALEMRNSSLKHPWNGTKFLLKLKILDLSHSYGLIKTPNFSGLPCLERLMLKDCISLVEVHESIGCLDRLVFLSFKGCKNLRKLPRNIGMLVSLSKLILSGCSKLELPEELVKFKSLRTLNADGTAVHRLPCTSGDLTKLSTSTNPWHLNFWSWISQKRHPEKTGFSLGFLPCSLVSLSLAGCNLPDVAIPSNLSSLPSLQYLDLSRNPICSLPECFSHLTMLQSLHIRHCTSLQSLPELPTSLKELDANGCTLLETVKNLPNLFTSLILHVEGCRKLLVVQDLLKLEPIENIDPELNKGLRLFDSESIGSIDVEMLNNFTGTTRKMPIQGFYECGIFNIFLPGDKVPDWFSYTSMGSAISLKVPLLPNHKIQGLYICIVYALSNKDPHAKFESYIKVCNASKGCRWAYSPALYAVPEDNKDMVWLSHWKFQDQLEGGDEVIVSVVMADVYQEKKFGIHFVYEQEETGTPYEEIRHHTSPRYRYHSVVDRDNSAYEFSPGAYFLCNHRVDVHQLNLLNGTHEAYYEDFFTNFQAE